MGALATVILTVSVMSAVTLSVLSRRLQTKPAHGGDQEVLRTAVRLDAAALGVFVVGSLAAGVTAGLQPHP